MEAELCSTPRGFQRLTDPLFPLRDRLAATLTLDPRGEGKDLDRDTLKDAAFEAFPDSSVEPVVNSTLDLAKGGFAVFEAPTLTDEADDGLALPWLALSDLTHSLHGTFPEMREALGIADARDADEVAVRLQAGFPYVPEWLLAGGAAARFLADASLLTAPGVDNSTPPPRPPGSHQLAGVSAASVEDMRIVGRGFSRGKWNGLGGHWWGWPFGWQVAIEPIAAGKLADMLLGFGGGGKVFDAIKFVLSAESVSAGVRALSLTAGAAAAIYAAALGANIRAVKNSKGVRLQGNWPVVGGPGAFIWAIKG